MNRFAPKETARICRAYNPLMSTHICRESSASILGTFLYFEANLSEASCSSSRRTTQSLKFTKLQHQASQSQSGELLFFETAEAAGPVMKILFCEYSITNSISALQTLQFYSASTVFQVPREIPRSCRTCCRFLTAASLSHRTSKQPSSVPTRIKFPHGDMQSAWMLPAKIRTHCQ